MGVGYGFVWGEIGGDVRAGYTHVRETGPDAERAKPSAADASSLIRSERLVMQLTTVIFPTSFFF